MQVRWKQFLIQSLLWLAAEVVLTSLGMDDLADYGEYHFTPRYVAIASIVTPV